VVNALLPVLRRKSYDGTGVLNGKERQNGRICRGRSDDSREEARQRSGKVAAAAGATPETSSTVAPPVKQPSSKVPKLEKKNKNRLPRREKKTRQKAANV
jgi:hypothetical protein